ncbi:AbrB family transcriptional regulator [Bacillus methanolicus]|uniref:AbrB/MazE/SpoVT family DNA-binding domain-containing protein n=1 Tax=Bacillus methanolicus TaxID=1471 RepID=UPI00237FD9F3|nr:AbrB/MazE/SpoVT family DNA-binding domain-containing protein [Bacillus methanolicus]MDE3840653.1 AbrB family transcriptional regulator [Bacillus methanolicus]
MNKRKGNQPPKGVNIYSSAYTSTLSSKYQVTVPSKVREIINAEPGDQVIFAINANNEVVVKVNKKNSLLSLFGSMPPKGNSEPMEWSDIREQAREERFTPNN